MHIKHMLLGGGAVFVLLVVLGVPLGTALPWALLLACPLMMLLMMRHMNGSGGQSSGERKTDGGEGSDRNEALR